MAACGRVHCIVEGFADDVGCAMFLAYSGKRICCLFCIGSVLERCRWVASTTLMHGIFSQSKSKSKCNRRILSRSRLRLPRLMPSPRKVGSEQATRAFRPLHRSLHRGPKPRPPWCSSPRWQWQSFSQQARGQESHRGSGFVGSKRRQGVLLLGMFRRKLWWCFRSRPMAGTSALTSQACGTTCRAIGIRWCGGISGSWWKVAGLVALRSCDAAAFWGSPIHALCTVAAAREEFSDAGYNHSILTKQSSAQVAGGMAQPATWSLLVPSKQCGCRALVAGLVAPLVLPSCFSCPRRSGVASLVELESWAACLLTVAACQHTDGCIMCIPGQAGDGQHQDRRAHPEPFAGK